MEHEPKKSSVRSPTSTASAVLLMVCTAASRFLGFIRVAVIGAIFGDSGMADVLNAAFFIPNNFRKLLAEGALSSAFIPVMSSIIEKRSFSDARRLSQSLLTFLLVLLLPLIACSLIFAEPIVRVLLRFPDPQKIALTVDLFRWVFCYIGFVSIGSVLMGILHTHGNFVVPGLAPLLFSLCVISSILVLHRRFGIFSLAFGVLGGGLLQVVMQLPFVIKQGYSLQLDFQFHRREFKKVLKLWIPVVATSSIFAVNQQIALLFASGLEDGSTTALTNAIVFWQLPFGVFSASVVTVMFPKMSRLAARDDIDGLIASISYGIRFLLVLLIPSAIAFIFAGRELIRAALQRYQFSTQGTHMASRVLIGYAIGLFSVGGYSFLQRFFYAMKDYKTPLMATVTVCILDVFLSLWLKETGLRVAGLAVANSLSFTFGFILLLVLSKKKLGRIDGKRIAKTGGKIFAAMIPVCISMYLFLFATKNRWTEDNSVSNIVLLLILMIIWSAVTLGMYLFMKIDIVKALITKQLYKQKENSRDT